MLRVGIVGAGSMGKVHSDVYANLGNIAVLTSICDIDKDKAEKIAIPKGAKSFDLNEFGNFLKSVDMVDICLPTYLHLEYTSKAAKAGKHVLCEKPMALNLKEADKMIEVTNKAKVKFMIAQCIRFWPEYVVLKEFVDKRKLGRLKNLFLSRLSPMPTWGYNKWFSNPKISGGAVLDLHIHDTDFILYLLGIPESVYSKGTINKIGLSHIYTSFNYKNIAVISEGGWDMPSTFPFNMSYTAIFEDGVLSFSLRQNPILVCYMNGKETFTPKIPKPKVKDASMETQANISNLGAYFNEIKYFVECIKKGVNPKIVTPKDARESIRTVLSEIESVKSGKSIKL